MAMDTNTNLKKRNKITLYVKEQLVIGTMVLCFVLSGICLPFIKERISSKPSGSTTESSQPSNATEEKKDKDSETNNSDSSQNTTVPDESNVPNTVTPSDSTNTENDNSSNKTPSESPGNTTEPSVPPTTDGGNGSGSTTKTPGKEWVPPVYETIHHEAVYETKTFYYCTGTVDESGVVCNERFETLESWATHKSIHGG